MPFVVDHSLDKITEETPAHAKKRLHSFLKYGDAADFIIKRASRCLIQAKSEELKARKRLRKCLRKFDCSGQGAEG